MLHLLDHLSLSDLHGGDTAGLLLNALLLPLQLLDVVELAVVHARLPHLDKFFLSLCFLVPDLSGTVLVLLDKRSHLIFFHQN